MSTAAENLPLPRRCGIKSKAAAPLPSRCGIKLKAAAPLWYKIESSRAAVLYEIHVAAVLLHLNILKTLPLLQRYLKKRLQRRYYHYMKKKCHLSVYNSHAVWFSLEINEE